MHIVVTDSGVGGLSVVAYAERFLRNHGFREPVRITFANAAPANDYGYNSMKTTDEKVATFDRFLRRVADRFVPDLIYVACNTLSVLIPDTPFAARGAVPVRGLVDTAVDVVMNELAHDSRAAVIIFGTPTTVDAGTYPRLLAQRGIDPARIVSQACPGLADVISEDRRGERTAEEIRRWVGNAIEKLPADRRPVVASLNCTHYGYRKNLFEQAFDEHGVMASVIDPNERAVGDLFPGDSATFPDNRDADVKVVSRYVIPDGAVDALSFFLAGVSPRTVDAIRNFETIPDLF